jgi:hypothetical protein
VQRPPGHIGVVAHTGYGMGPAGMVTQEGDGSVARPQTDAEGTFGPPVSGFPVRRFSGEESLLLWRAGPTCQRVFRASRKNA